MISGFLILMLIILYACAYYNKNIKNKENVEIYKDDNVKIYENNFINEEETTLYSSKSPVIPIGFKKVETESASWKENDDGIILGWNNGLVIEDECGNQFVWIPVENIEDFNKIEGYYGGEIQNYISNCNEANYNNKTIESIELYKSVKKYKGFYIARYEAGINDIYQKHVQDGSIKPLSKSNTDVWNKIVWGSAYGYALDGIQGSDTENGAVKVARSMYPNVNYLSEYKLPKDLQNNTGVVSTLCYGVQWDAVMRFISNIDNPHTKTKYIVDSTNMGWYAFNSKSTLQRTGTSVDSNNSNCVKNIYDLAGNVYEWTMESYKDNYRIYRGGMCEMGNVKPSASMRAHAIPNIFNGSPFVGFRVALYIK